MAIIIVIGTILTIIAIMMGSMVLFPVIHQLQTEVIDYDKLSTTEKVTVDRAIGMASMTPAVLIGVVFVWAFLRSGRNDHF